MACDATSGSVITTHPGPRVRWPGAFANIMAHPTEPIDHMASRHAVNRFEVKYFVATRQVPALVADLEPFSTADVHAEGPGGYSVFSVYWDTPELLFFWQKVEGVKQR